MPTPGKKKDSQPFYCQRCGSLAVAAPAMQSLNTLPDKAGTERPVLNTAQLEKSRKRMISGKKFFAYCCDCDRISPGVATLADLPTLMPEVLS